jgi:hypothetical protein
VTSDLAATDVAAPAGQTPAPSKRRSVLWYLIPLVILIDVVALIVSPPLNTAQPGEACAFPACFVESTLHLPAPHVMYVPSGEPASTEMITAQVSFTDSLLTMMVITVIVLVGLILLRLRLREVPGARQNFIEWAIESLEGFARGMGGAAATRYVPLFAAFFILILMFNWSGLLPIVGRIEGLRASPWSRSSPSTSRAFDGSASRATRASSSRSTSSSRASGRASSRCSWGSWS